MEAEVVQQVWYQSSEFYTVLSGAGLLVVEWIMRYVPTRKPVKFILWLIVAMLRQVERGLEKTIEVVPDRVVAPVDSVVVEPVAPKEDKKKWYQFWKKRKKD